MKRGLTVIVSLSIIALALLGTGAWFLANRSEPGTMELTVAPGPGSVLPNSSGDPSQIVLESVQLEKAASDQQYRSLPGNVLIKPGDPILLLTLAIQNTHATYRIVGISAVGYDASSKPIAWTLDDSLHEMSWAQLAYGETGEITAHLNFLRDIRSIKITGNNYQYPVP